MKFSNHGVSMLTTDTYDCGCEKEDSLKWLNYVKKGSIIFWISATVIAVTLTILYHLGIRP